MLFSVAMTVLAEETRPKAEQVRLVVYLKRDCAACSFFESVVRPALEHDLGDALVIDQRRVTAEKTVAPLIILQGSSDFVLLGLSIEGGFDRLMMAVDAAMDPSLTGLTALGGMTVIEAGQPPYDSSGLEP